MTTITEQQVASLRSALDRIDELADKIKQALAADDPAEAEGYLGELADTVATVHSALDSVTAEETPASDEPPAP